MSQQSDRGPQHPEPSPFSLIDIPDQNPWWVDESALPPQSQPRTDLYWRVRNTLEHDLMLIPGAPLTGTTTTLEQIVRALILGTEHEEERIQQLFRDGVGDIEKEGCNPKQVCLATCSDPLSHLVEDYVNEVRKAYHTLGAQTGKLDFYLLLDDVHRLDSWREQLVETYTKLEEDFPEDWTLVATVPVARLIQEMDFEGVEDLEVDMPHHTQKFRDTLFSQHPGLENDIRPVGVDETQLDRTRVVFGEAARGKADPETLCDAFSTLEKQIRESASSDELHQIIDTYLTVGGFAPAIAGSTSNVHPQDGSTDDLSTHSTAAIQSHIDSGLATTLYQDVPRLAKTEPDLDRIENPEDLHAMIAFLARREFTETTYIGLADFLDCDTRTIRQKYVPILEDLHIGERSTRYDLTRNRTLRFYLRSPGYLTAFRHESVTDDDRVDRLRMTLSDHLRRLLAKFDSDEILQYWRDEDYLVDYVIDVEDDPVLFVSGFSDEVGGTVDAFAAFAEQVTSHNLEVVITESDGEVEVKELEQGRLRLLLPHWLLLSVC